MIFKNLIGSNEIDASSNLSAPKQWLIDFFGGGETSSGESVTEDSAMKMSAVYACVKILAESVAKLPLQVFQETKGKKTRNKNHKVSYLLETRPNPYFTPFAFKEQMEAHRQLFGNAYAEIQWGRDGYPKALWILDPRVTEIKMDINGKFWFTTILPSGEGIKLRYENVLHLPNLSIDGIRGMSPISVAREIVGNQMASQKYSGSFYKNGTSARGILTVPRSYLKERSKR